MVAARVGVHPPEHTRERLESGRADVDLPGRAVLAGLRQSNPEIQYNEVEFNLIPFVYWKLDKPPFNDPRVRQAVSMSLNRDNTIQVLYNGRGNWDNFMPWALSEWWLDPRGPDQGPTARYFTYDPAGARQVS